MIFNLAPGSPTDTPTTSLHEHTFGVRCMAFSNDSRWLCSVGDLHDGFIYMWSINAKTGTARLHSSNKCITPIQGIAWIGNSVTTIGTRYVKVWRLERAALTSPSKPKTKLDHLESGKPSSPGPKMLSGRNSLLGPLLDLDFTCIVAISDSKAILGTDQGEVCLLDDENYAQSLSKIYQVDLNITCITSNPPGTTLWLGGKEGGIDVLSLDEKGLATSLMPSERPSLKSSPVESSDCVQQPGILAMATFQARLVAVDSKRVLSIRNLSGQNIAAAVDAHDSAVLGVSTLHQPNDQSSMFFTWSASGFVKFWTLEGACKATLEIPLNRPNTDSKSDLNELKIVRASESGKFFLSGDKLGFLVLSRGASIQDTVMLKAHDGEINDIALAQRSGELRTSILASCGRDRTVQIYKEDESQMSLVQTIEHGGAVNQVLFCKKGTSLITSSADRTLKIHTVINANDSIAYLPTRVITLKNSPVSMTVMPEDSTLLLVSTMDRQLHEYSTTTGHHLRSFRTADGDNESVVMSSVVIAKWQNGNNQMRLMFGITSADKSLRIYDYSKNLLLLKGYGHTSGISSLAFVQHDTDSKCINLITTGLDGIIMVWELALLTQAENGNMMNELPIRSATTSPIRDLSDLTSPLRRILSKSEICQLQKSLKGSQVLTSEKPKETESPSRIRRKCSQLTPTNKASNVHPLPTPSPTTTVARRRLQTQSLKAASPKLDHTPMEKVLHVSQHGTKNADILNDLNISSSQICSTLRGYRKRIEISTESVDLDTADELERELSLTIREIGQNTERTRMSSSKTPIKAVNDENAEV